ncbi:membrane protein [Bacteroidia bacterium]|nr:membrane protein [Bacteroidia bacterium]
MNYFKKQNLLWGWCAFAISALVYILSMEPTTSLWDCAEFIATSYRLEVGHPPGAPLFMMIGRLFSMLAPAPQYAAMMINLMSSLCSAFCILFLFWTITHLGRRVLEKQGLELTPSRVLAVMGAGMIGSIAYTFTDTFWFSAIEGEVYAMSSLFTAVVVWAMLKWEEVADEPHANRWLVLIAYMMGLSTGVHILNLLCIPALAFIYYFRKTERVTRWGVVKATLAGGGILVAVNYIVIPFSVSIGAWFDKLFVNTLGAPVNSGITTYALLVFGLCAWGIWYTYQRRKVVANTIILCTTMILLGYGSYASEIIRAAANPPMNSNDPSNPYALLSLLSRDQYGDRPLLTGPCYNSPAESVKEKSLWYLGDDGKYREGSIMSGVVYPPEFTFFFPRMYSSRGDHPKAYESWGRVRGDKKIPYRDELIPVPTFGENLTYFFSYQLNFMYWRYFLWNFAGRQSDVQSTGEITDGNWLSGINFIDELYLGPQDRLPSEMAANKGHNRYYFLPFILGIIGLLYQLNRDKRNFAVVLWLFFTMGIALVLYFNVTPGEPRERDYVYAGSFYAFCIWIGFGVMWLHEKLVKMFKRESRTLALAATAICSCVPILLGAQNWDDHDRSHRYTTRDLGWNYLQSAIPGSIVMNFGDNDTFPLWYNQEVEEVRTDIRVMNMSYLGADWYIDEMKRRYRDSDPVPFSLPRSKYVNCNDYLYINDMVDGKPLNIKSAINFIAREDPRTKVTMTSGMTVDYLPAKTLALPVNRANAIASGIVREQDASLVADTIFLTIKKSSIDKSELLLLDLLANFDWKRPLYFTQTYSISSLGLRDYLQFDGYAYRLVPIRTPYESPLAVGRVDADYLWDRLMNTFRFGNIADERVYADYFIQTNHNAAQSRNAYARLAMALIERGDTTRAVEALDYCIEQIPFSQIRHTYILTIPLIEAYYRAGAIQKGDAILDDYSRILKEYVVYYQRFTGRSREQATGALQEKLSLLGALYQVAQIYGRDEKAGELDAFFHSAGVE